MNLVLTVCVGNICRSPMAEALLTKALPRTQVMSAGLAALVGQPADPIARDLMLERGIDISAHRAQQINQIFCQKADIILTMDVAQKKYIEEKYPSSRGKVFRLADTAGQDIDDPYRQGHHAFEDALSLIESGVDIWVNRIRKLNERERQLT